MPPEPLNIQLATTQSHSAAESASPSRGQSVEDELSRKCRMLARSVGHDAVHEQQQGSLEHSTSPFALQRDSNRSSSTSSPQSRSPRLQYSHHGLSPLSPSSKLPPPSPRSSVNAASLAYPTPEGSFVLSNIREEDLASTATTLASERSLHPHQQREEEEDDEVSDLDSYMMGDRRRLSSHTTLGSLQIMHQENLDETLLRSSLTEGVSHFEIDVWLVEGDLLVGSDKHTLSAERTLSSMYLDPLLHLFDSPSSASSFSFTPHHRRRSSAASGVLHPRYWSQPLLLLLNLHTDPVMTFQFLLHYLTPLLDASLLTTFCPNSAALNQGLITVASTDATDVLKSEIANLTPRYVFLAAKLEDETSDWNKQICTIVTADIKEVIGDDQKYDKDGDEGLTNAQVSKVTDYVTRAHDQGAKLRLGGTGRNESLVQQLAQLGVDYC
ncbi:hypothetical protein OIO90_001153 [Microbotryomycetes sp. JL221]|nr:hypothetical protein OIO90_001153 [Microbotryomycetes sp. JL221]